MDNSYALRPHSLQYFLLVFINGKSLLGLFLLWP